MKKSSMKKLRKIFIFNLFFSIFFFGVFNFTFAGVVCVGWESYVKNAVQKSSLSECSNLHPEEIMHAQLYQESSCGRAKMIQPSLERCIQYRSMLCKTGKIRSQRLCSPEGLRQVCTQYMNDLKKVCDIAGYCDGTSPDFGMGPAQFQPTTWLQYVPKLKSLGISNPNPWNPEHAILAQALKLKTDGFCKDPSLALRLYNGAREYAEKILELAFGSIKKAVEAMGRFLEDLFSKRQKLELEYPEIFGLKPKTPEIGLEFFKYIYLFVIWSLGFLLFIVLLYYSILWYTAGANIEQALRAKQRIIQAFFGAILLLGSWILLEILGPQFTKIQKEIPSPQEVKTLPEVTKKEGKKVVVAKRIVLDHLVNKSVLSPSATTTPTKANFDEILKYRTFGVNSASGEVQFGLGEEQGFAMDNVPNSDASYNWGQALVSDQEREQIKRDAENFVNMVSDEEKRRQYKTTIREVREAINTAIQECCSACGGLMKTYNECTLKCNETCSSNCASQQGEAYNKCKSDCLNNCYSGCSPLRAQYERCSTECAKLRELKKKADEFPSNSEYPPTVNSLENLRDGVNKVEEKEFELPPGNYSHYKDEDYYERGKNSANEILNFARSINCGNCAEGSGACEKMKSTVEDFVKGWEIRKAGWQVILEAQNIAQKQSQYINLLRENLKSGTDYLYEGTVAPSRIERILGTNKVLRIKTDFAKNLVLTTEALSAAITALLVGGCHCPECVGCGACAGDACIVVRPLLSALQVALGINIVAMPPVAQQVQKEVDKEIREKDELKKSLEELTEGLALAEKEIFTCQGVTRHGEFKQLFSALEFLNYKNEVEKRGYKVIIQDLWPNIKPEGDAFVFYCVTGPLVEGISDIYDPNNLKNLKLYCEQNTESEVGELFDKIKEVIKGKEQILDQKDKEIKNAQKLVNEMRRNQKGLEQGLDALENSKGELSPDALNQIGEKLKNIPGQQFAEMIGKLPEKYAKEAIGNIIENIAGKDAKNFLVGVFEGMKEGDFKEMFNKYLSSMMDKEVKKFTHAFLEAIPDKNLKNILIQGFDSFSEDKLKEFWKNSLKNFTENEKRIFFSKYLRDVDERKLEILYDYFVKNSSEVEKKQMLKEMLEASSPSVVRVILEKYIKISLNPIKNENSNEFVKIEEVLAQETIDLEQVISEIPSKELDEVLAKTKKILKEKNYLRNAMRNVSHEILESAISRIPESEIKQFTRYFYEGIDENDIKDFVLETVLDADPTYFQKFMKELPEKKIKDLILEQGFKALPDSQAKDILILMHELPNMDPRKVLNPLFLNYIPKDKLSSAMGILQSLGIVDQFLAEASAVFGFPNVSVSGIIKDIVDKIASFTEKLQDVVNQILDTIKLPFDQLVNYVRDVWNQLPNLTVGELLNDIIKDIPYQDLLASIKEALKSIPFDELKNIAKEIFDQLPLEELKKAFQDIIDELPIEEIKSALNDVISALPLEELKNLLDKLSLVTKSEIFRECIYPYLTKEEQLKFPKLSSEEDWRYFMSKLQSKRGIYCALKYIPEKELKQMLKEAVSKLPKADLSAILSKLPSINLHLDKFLNKLPLDSLKKLLKAFPEKELKNFFNTLAKKLPVQKLREALNKALSVFQNTVNKLFNQLLSKLPLQMLNNLVKQLLSALPIKQLVETFNQIISQLSTQVLGPILGQLQQLLGPLFSLLTGGPGLKQNAIVMMTYPTQYLTACPRCCYSKPPKCPVCKGTPGPLIMCSPKPVLQRMALITINVGKILLFKKSIDEALAREEEIIQKKIKEDIWPTVTHNTYIFSSKQCITIEPGKEGYLVKCEDALRYGWVGKCDHKHNFVCCRKK